MAHDSPFLESSSKTTNKEHSKFMSDLELLKERYCHTIKPEYTAQECLKKIKQHIDSMLKSYNTLSSPHRESSLRTKKQKEIDEHRTLCIECLGYLNPKPSKADDTNKVETKVTGEYFGLYSSADVDGFTLFSSSEQESKASNKQENYKKNYFTW